MSNIVENNTAVTVHYTGTLEDGTKFDSSRDRDTPFTFETGTGQVVPGFNDAVVGMTVGEIKTATLVPKTAYGEHNENAFQVVSKTVFDADFDFTEGNTVTGQNGGKAFRAVIEGTTRNHVVLDLNHPLAGKTLTFEIEVISIN